jgi:hypothetical protein
MICPTASRARHDDGISGSKQDGHGFYVASDASDEKYCGVAQPELDQTS